MSGDDVAAWVRGIRAGDRAVLARAITLVESARPDHRDTVHRLLAALGEPPVPARRVGITGVPGAGKSTFVDALGSLLAERGHRVAVLAVDPTSARSGGSILGDRTRMTRLAGHDSAFVRPSPSGGALGGVATTTRAVIALVEASGYDTVLVETVGVGQSESAVAQLVDSVLLLAVAGTGDELQGIKKGVLEHADVVAVNKADGPNLAAAQAAARQLSRALRLGRPGVPVLTCSAAQGSGVAQVWDRLLHHHDDLAGSGELAARRARQRAEWVWSLVAARLLADLRGHRGVQALAAELERAADVPATLAADRIVAAFLAR